MRASGCWNNSSISLAEPAPKRWGTFARPRRPRRPPADARDGRKPAPALDDCPQRRAPREVECPDRPRRALTEAALPSERLDLGFGEQRQRVPTQRLVAANITTSELRFALTFDSPTQPSGLALRPSRSGRTCRSAAALAYADPRGDAAPSWISLGPSCYSASARLGVGRTVHSSVLGWCRVLRRDPSDQLLETRFEHVVRVRLVPVDRVDQRAVGQRHAEVPFPT